ncbi:MAG: hypothetical protein ACKVH8_19310 [Pirellulales bacterium]
MGNQREIRQLTPTYRLGVAIPVRVNSLEIVADILSQYKQGHFYTYVVPADTECSIWNMDGDDIHMGASSRAYFIIQSGGKMWCGYDEFCNHINSVAKYIEDARFFVGDAEDYIDEFAISNGRLIYERFHSGFWIPVDEYLRKCYPETDR